MKRDFQAPGRSPVFAQEAAAATSHPLATSAALEVLQAGGNAVDAAIAAVAVQCVVEPHMTGIGGDCFAIVMEPDGRLTGFNGSGAAPRAATPQKLAELGVKDITDTSPHANLICLRCHASEDDHGPLAVRDLPAQAEAVTGFRASAIRVDIFGFCAACRERKKSEIRQQWLARRNGLAGTEPTFIHRDEHQENLA